MYGEALPLIASDEREDIVPITSIRIHPAIGAARVGNSPEFFIGRLARMAVETVLTFYAARAAQEGGLGPKSGAVTVVQRTSSDLRLNPHLHLIVLDGTWCEQGGELAWEGLGHLGTQRSGRGAGARGPAHGEAPSPGRAAADL